MNYALLAMTAIDGLFARINWQPLFEDHGIPLAIMGLFVVFAALILLCIFIGLLPRIMAVLDHFYPEQQEVSLSRGMQETKTGEFSGDLPDELLAVIAAVVAETVRVPHRIVRTRELSPEDLSWSLEGRRQHHASHRIHPRDHR